LVMDICSGQCQKIVTRLGFFGGDSGFLFRNKQASAKIGPKSGAYRQRGNN